MIFNHYSATFFIYEKKYIFVMIVLPLSIMILTGVKSKASDNAYFLTCLLISTLFHLPHLYLTRTSQFNTYHTFFISQTLHHLHKTYIQTHPEAILYLTTDCKIIHSNSKLLDLLHLPYHPTCLEDIRELLEEYENESNKNLHNLFDDLE